MGSCLSTESSNPIPGSPNSPARRAKKRKSSKKRLGSRSSFDYRREEPLHRIPGRMFLNGSSEVASLYTQQGRKGTNQDAMIVWENFGLRSDTIFCGVFDGHGPFGHMVAKRVRDSLPLKVKAQWEFSAVTEEVVRELSADPNGETNRDDDEGGARVSIDVAELEKPKEIVQTLKESFLKASKAMDRELRMHPSIDCFCSGTTAVTLVKQGKNLVIGNVGDSRAVMATRDKDDTLVAIQLTVDLKPNLPGEEERIRSCKGRVFALEDEPEVARVWLPHSDSPGLAMARAFGDFCLKDFGLISVPEITSRQLTEKDEFVVMATDGIWDVLSNSEVVDIVASAQSRPTAARALVEAAVRGWQCKYPTSKVDDCAVVCLFFDSNSNNSSMASNAKSKDGFSSEVRICNGNAAINEDVSGPSDVNRTGAILTVKDILGGGEEEEEEEDDDDDDGGNLARTGSKWLALEGVSRVNTLLTLPRFVSSKKEKAW